MSVVSILPRPALMSTQSKMLLGESNGVVKSSQGKPTLMNHKSMETYLGRYSGLLLYLKEMDEAVYAKLCAVCLVNVLVRLL